MKFRGEEFSTGTMRNFQPELTAGAKPGNEIPLGADGTVWKEGHAISERGRLRGKRCRREGKSLRRTDGDRLLRQGDASAYRQF
jgi:hypothetical protein